MRGKGGKCESVNFLGDDGRGGGGWRIGFGFRGHDGALSEKSYTYHVQKYMAKLKQQNGTSITKDGSYSSKERYHKTCQLSFFAFSSG